MGPRPARNAYKLFLRGRARCVAHRAFADAASAAWSWRALAVGRWRGEDLGGIDVWPCGIVCCSLCGLTHPPSIGAARFLCFLCFFCFCFFSFCLPTDASFPVSILFQLMHFVLGMGEVIQGWDLGLLGMDGQIFEFSFLVSLRCTPFSFFPFWYLLHILLLTPFLCFQLMHFVLGMGEVTQGWDLGLLGMRRGGTLYVFSLFLFFLFGIYFISYNSHPFCVFSSCTSCLEWGRWSKGGISACSAWTARFPSFILG